MKRVLSFIILLWSFNVLSKESLPLKVGLTLNFESLSIETEESNSTNRANASFFSGQIVPSLGFFLHPQILLGAQYSQSLLGEFGVSGIGAFGRFYFLGGSSRKIELDGVEGEIAPDISLYAGLAYKNLSIGSGEFDIRFSGLECSVGVEKLITGKYFFTGGLSITHLSSSSNRQGLSFGAFGGIGYNY